MGNPHTNKRERGHKRSNTQVEVEKAKKKKLLNSKAAPILVHIPIGDVSEEEEEEIPSGKLAFDTLLKILGSGSDEKLTKLYERRQREQEGISDSEEDDDDGSEKENGGLGSESDMDDIEDGDLREHAPYTINEQDEDETSSEDDAGSASNKEINTDDLIRTSSFHRHLEHILTNEDADKLMESELKYKWEIAAPNMSTKWVGTNEHLTKDLGGDVVHGLNKKLYKHWQKTYGASDFAGLNSQLKFYFSLCNSYMDIMHCNKKPFYLKGDEDSVIMDSYLMHTLNHVFKTKDLVSRNSAKLTREREDNDEEFLDHGFTRPKVMFLLPLRSIAYRIVKRLIQLAPASNKTKVEHIDRFSEEFGTEGIVEDDGSSERKKTEKPKDFQRLFGGNNDDHFLIGIKFTKKCIKLYGDYYSSDIIIASPLGLVTKIDEAEEEKEKDVDFLSSIEILVIDHADVIAMQNWSLLNTVVEQLNRTPTRQHGTDIMRIRRWYLNGHARFYRQTILLSSLLNSDMNILFSRSCMNYDGKVKLLSDYKGVLPEVLLQVPQVYDRFDAPSIDDKDDARLDYFCKKVFPKIKDSMEGGTMLFISSYFEFYRIRIFLKSQNASFCWLGEYTKPEDISRARNWFFDGERKIILYTERAHFYHRYKIRGVKNLIMYSLPERKEFYPEIINMIERSNNMTCRVLFSHFDYLQLESIVGTVKAKKMVSSEENSSS